MISTTRIAAVLRKEFAEFRRNRFIVTTAGVLPLVFLISPTASLLSVKVTTASTALDKRVDAALFLPLLVPVFAAAPVAAAVRHAPQLPAALVFIPLLAAWAIWAGLAISTRATDTRVAYQLSVLSSLPPVAVTALMSFNVITPTFGTAAAFAGGLLVVDSAACLGVSRLFDRERLITGTRS